MLRETKETIESITTPEEREEAQRGERVLPERELRDEVAQQSNDGPPGDLEVHAQWYLAPLFIIVVSMFAAAILIGIFVNRTLGTLIGIGCLLYMLANPAMWAAFSKAAERRKAARHVRARHR